jgi:hypothetical protein
MQKKPVSMMQAVHPSRSRVFPSSHSSPSLVYVEGFYLQWFRRGLVIKADRPLYHSTLGVKDAFFACFRRRTPPRPYLMFNG